jgi:hypothetical protein
MFPDFLTLPEMPGPQRSDFLLTVEFAGPSSLLRAARQPDTVMFGRRGLFHAFAPCSPRRSTLVRGFIKRPGDRPGRPTSAASRCEACSAQDWARRSKARTDPATGSGALSGCPAGTRGEIGFASPDSGQCYPAGKRELARRPRPGTAAGCRSSWSAAGRRSRSSGPAACRESASRNAQRPGLSLPGRPVHIPCQRQHAAGDARSELALPRRAFGVRRPRAIHLLQLPQALVHARPPERERNDCVVGDKYTAQVPKMLTRPPGRVFLRTWARSQILRSLRSALMFGKNPSRR